MSEVEPRPGSTAALDARVARLESQFDTLTGKVSEIALRMERISSDQGHLVTLLTTQHQAVTAELQLLRARYHNIEDLVARTTAEPQQTPAGRAILARLDEQDAMKNEAHDRLSKAVDELREENGRTRTWIARASGVAAIFVILAQLAAPVIARFIGLR